MSVYGKPVFLQKINMKYSTLSAALKHYYIPGSGFFALHWDQITPFTLLFTKMSRMFNFPMENVLAVINLDGKVYCSHFKNLNNFLFWKSAINFLLCKVLGLFFKKILNNIMFLNIMFLKYFLYALKLKNANS